MKLALQFTVFTLRLLENALIAFYFFSESLDYCSSLMKMCSWLKFRRGLPKCKWAPSSEFVSSSIPSWQISTAHAQPFRGARDLAFCLKVPLDSLLVWASSEGSGETARMRRLAWTFAARIGDKYQIRLARPKYPNLNLSLNRKLWKIMLENFETKCQHGKWSILFNSTYLMMGWDDYLQM